MIEGICLFFPSIMQISKQKNGTETCTKKIEKNSTTPSFFHHDESYQQKIWQI